MARPAKVWLRGRDNCWWVTINGKQTNLGVRGAQNEAAAWREFHRLKSGQPQTPPHSPQPLSPTVRQVVDAFLADAADRLTPYALQQCRLYLLPFAGRFSDRSADSLICPEVEAYSRKPDVPNRKSKVWSESTRSKFLATVNRAFRFGERSRLIDRNPIRHLSRPPVASRTAKVLISEEEYAKLYAVAAKEFRPVLEFCRLTFCRPGEASRLTAGCVNWADRIIEVRDHKNRNRGKSRTIYMSDEVYALIRKCADKYPTGPLFRNRLGNQWEWRTLGAAMRSTARRAGLPGKILYGLRHSGITEALATGYSSEVVAEMAGNSPKVIFSNYSHIATKRKMLVEAANGIWKRKNPPE
jgi:integrase